MRRFGIAVILYTALYKGMDNMQREDLFKQKYSTLPTAEREPLLRSLADSRFQLLRFECFTRFGMQTDTAVYLCDGHEFVFVPGDTVTLGWADFAVGMDDKTRRDMKKSLEEYEITNLDAFLRESMSTVRTVTLPPMLVERNLNDIGWRRVTLDSQELEPFQEDIKKHFGAKDRMLTIHGQMRIYRKDDEVITEMYEPVPMDDFFVRVHQNGFSLPTEDEWEYLCGGGSRTLFRWGDSFDYDMKLYHFAADKSDDTPYTLEQSNQFGLSIAYDPYKQEVVENSEYFLKGGDGGCNICGGSGVVLGYLPTATYFRGECLSANELDYKSDIGGDYTFYRRIVRL